MHRPITLPAKLLGLTIVELMVGLAVVGIVATVGAPSLANFVDNQRRVATTNDLVATFNLARSEALNLVRHVTVCPSEDAQTCSTSGDWKHGWIVFANTAQNNVAERGSDETLIRVFPPVHGNVSFTSPDGLGDVVAYRPTGDLDVAGTLVYCDERGDAHAGALVVERSGRVRASRETFDGSSLSCAN